MPDTKPNTTALHESSRPIDPESEGFLHRIEEERRVRSNLFSGVKSILVMLSSRGMVYDIESLRQKITLAYPGATVFFLSTLGKPIGSKSPSRVDLLIDFTGPGTWFMQGIFYARKLRRMARHAVGRNAGLFRKSAYHRVFDESRAKLPGEMLARERLVQKEVLALAGVPLASMGDTPPDRGKLTPLQLPPMRRL